MIPLLLFLFSVLTPAAYATPPDHAYTVVMDIPLVAPPTGQMNFLSQRVIRVPNPSPAIPDNDIASNWAPLSCGFRSNTLYIRVKGNHNTWPTSLPSGDKAVCTGTYNNETYELTVKLVAQTGFAWPSNTAGTPTTGFVFDFNVTLPADVGANQDIVLPAGHVYKEGKRAAMKGGNPWDGVLCLVRKHGTRYFVHADVDANLADAGTGHCMVKRQNGTTFNVPVEVKP